MSDNPVIKRLRQIYCLRGAQFCAPELQMAWEEIERVEAQAAELEAEKQGLESQIRDIITLVENWRYGQGSAITMRLISDILEESEG